MINKSEVKNLARMSKQLRRARRLMKKRAARQIRYSVKNLLDSDRV